MNRQIFCKSITSASALITVLASVATATPSLAASIFLTGHDPDFHAYIGGNPTGARKINQVGISYVMDPTFNTFVSGGINKFLFVESKISPPSGHTQGVNGIIASGYNLGSDFEYHDATTLNTELNLLGTKYSAIVVASDFGGILTQAELDILNSRKTDIVNFLQNGGGIYAMAESNLGARLTPSGGQFGFLPFITTSTALGQNEIGNIVTPFGNSIGLTNSDINGNASHNIFTGTFGLNIVDTDPQGHILSLAGRNLPTPPQSVPESSPLFGLSAIVALGALSKLAKKLNTPTDNTQETDS